jgi:hypothetical protein
MSFIKVYVTQRISNVHLVDNKLITGIWSRLLIISLREYRAVETEGSVIF